MIMIELWMLYFIVSGDAKEGHRHVVGGEYKSERECRDAGPRLMPQAHRWFGKNVRWRCELTKDKG